VRRDSVSYDDVSFVTLGRRGERRRKGWKRWKKATM
jgi:hypothetical protein